ncbi:MAG: hypothetical protein ABIH59_01195 [archaeon]
MAKLKKNNNKLGQTTIFIIIALVIVAVVLLILFLRSSVGPDTGRQPEKNHESFLETCIEESIKESVNLLSEQGGYIDPELYREFLFAGDTEPSVIAYLCYYGGYYKPCVNQEPVLLQHVSEEIKQDIQEDLYDCFASLGTSLEDQGYQVESRHRVGDFEVFLKPGSILINIEGEIKMIKSGETSVTKSFKIEHNSELYDLLSVTQEAINKEAASADCVFDHVNYQTLYPEFTIRKYNGNNGTEIYKIEKQDTEEMFMFATRGCVIPPGL